MPRHPAVAHPGGTDGDAGIGDAMKGHRMMMRIGEMRITLGQALVKSVSKKLLRARCKRTTKTPHRSIHIGKHYIIDELNFVNYMCMHA